MDELLDQHRKERKQLQAQCIHLKKQAQADKKKKNEFLAEIQRLELELEQRHQKDLIAFQSNASTSVQELETHTDTVTENDTSLVIENEILLKENPDNSEHTTPKLSRQRLRKLRKEKEIEEIRQKALSEPIVDHGSREIEQFHELLSPFRLKIHSIPANGHCLFNALAHQLQYNHSEEYSAPQLRKMAVDYMRKHKLEFIPFMVNEKTDDVASEDDFIHYCSEMETTGIWGGHLEIQALASALQKCVEVYQVASPQPILVGDPQHERLRISYHLHQYALGQHYNSLIG